MLPEIIRIAGLSKTFPGTRALIDVGLDIRAGEVHALVGHNGSGKSTLIKVLAGYHQADPGASVTLDGKPVDFAALTSDQSGDARVNFVHQDLGLVMELNTVDNLALRGGFATGRFGRVRWTEQERLARELIRPFAHDFDVTVPLSKVTPVERTLVAIAGALRASIAGHGVLVLDEPTAVLPPNEVGRLFDVVRELRSGGAGILYVSHRLDEIFELADRVTVLRNGRLVATRQVADIDKQELVELMVGRDVDADFRADIAAPAQHAPVLEVRNLAGQYVRNVSFALHRGEVLGVAGLPVDGRDELPRLLTDEAPAALGGEIRLASRTSNWAPLRAWFSEAIALLPPDRIREGIVAQFSVGENLSLGTLHHHGHALKLDRGSESESWSRWIKRLVVKTPSSESAITTLSGGNQQKVLFGRVLADQPEVLVMCEPTAGVDVGARQAIYELVAASVEDGLSVVVASSDVGDLMALCTRVLVLREGVVARELTGDSLNEVELLHAMEG